MRKILLQSLLRKPLSEPPPVLADPAIVRLARELDVVAQKKLGRGLSIRAVDAGSCNGCELEMHALNNAFYDLERFGLRFVASPRHADVLAATGIVTRNMREALLRTYAAMPHPKWVVAIGACAYDGGLFAESPECEGGIGAVLPVDLWISGCPPTPRDLLKGLLTLLSPSVAAPAAGPA
ncbi:MAG: NADH-quinone oxidoreductase subunit B family protein [Acidibrevibacterium sp.]|uniref:NADH-quinone oxidoreductase subunit B family protein n=1 Tax=Acidibrevibacterium sp. TaxID=2606776 RepID=UPI003D01486F